MINQIAKRPIALLLGLCLLPLSLCWGLSLDEARDQGLVGERPDGYVGLIDATPSAELRQLVDSINSQRRTKYSSIARNRQQPRSVVEALAGRKVREEIPAGSYFMDDRGTWQRK